MVVWDVATRKRLAEIPLLANEGNVHDIAFNPEGKILAAGYGLVSERGGGVVLWDVATHGKRLNDDPLAVKEGDVNSVAFSPDDKTLAAGFDGGVVLWDVATLQTPGGESPSIERGQCREHRLQP